MMHRGRRPDRRRSITLGGVIVLALIAITCGGGSPSAPSPGSGTPVNVAGTWTGTWTFVVAGVTANDQVTVTFTQSGQDAKGTLAAGNGTTGTFTFPARSITSGTMSLAVTSVGAACGGTASIAGTLGATDMLLTAASVSSTAGNCQWATDHRFSLRR